MLDWPSGAPLVFDIVGGGVGVALIAGFLALTGLKGPLNRQSDPRLANYERRAAALAGCVLSLYVLLVLVAGMGLGPLLLFITRAPLTPQPWSVWLTGCAWGLITTVSVFTLSRALKVPLAARIVMPYGRYAIQAAIFGGAWMWGTFIPMIAPRGDWWWHFILSANFGLRCIYLVCIAEGLAGLALAMIGRGGGARQAISSRVEERNAPMIPARRRKP